jgi:predicted DNA binding CopG/RHH family protein
MQQAAATNSPSSGSSSFAGLLASLASPAPREAERTAERTENWPGGDLGEDVVTLSYERALRTHSRYKAADRGDWAAGAAIAERPSFVGASACGRDDEHEGEQAARQVDGQAGKAAQTAAERGLRRKSVTIRLNKQECAQLRQRAAEAGLTVSAYLRSCVLEADALRAQVKSALAEMRATGSQDKPAETSGKPVATVVAERRWSRWLAKFFQGKHVPEPAVRG